METTPATILPSKPTFNKGLSLNTWLKISYQLYRNLIKYVNNNIYNTALSSAEFPKFKRKFVKFEAYVPLLFVGRF